MVEPDAPLGPRLLSQIPQIHKLYWILIVLGCVLSGPVTCLPHPLAHGSADAFSIQLDDSNHLQLQQEFSKFHISQNASAYWANSGKLNSSLDFDRSQMTQFTGTFYPPLTPSLTGGKKSQPTTTTLRPTQTPSLPKLPEIYLNGTQFHLPHQQNMTTKWMECLFGLVTCVECTLTPQPVTTEEELEAYTNELVECRLAFGFVSYQGMRFILVPSSTAVLPSDPPPNQYPGQSPIQTENPPAYTLMALETDTEGSTDVCVRSKRHVRI